MKPCSVDIDKSVEVCLLEISIKCFGCDEEQFTLVTSWDVTGLQSSVPVHGVAPGAILIIIRVAAVILIQAFLWELTG